MNRATTEPLSNSVFRSAAKKDRVDVADIDKFNEAISKAKDMLDFTLRYQTPEQIKKAKRISTFNWAVAASVSASSRRQTFWPTPIFVIASWLNNCLHLSMRRRE